MSNPKFGVYIVYVYTPVYLHMYTIQLRLGGRIWSIHVYLGTMSDPESFIFEDAEWISYERVTSKMGKYALPH